MWFGKKKFANFAMTLAVAVASLCGSAWAADVYPLHFDGIPADKQQAYWDHLMKFKLWGTNGISIGSRVSITDQLGWSGTADGPLEATADKENDTIGGPVIVGGNIDLQGKNMVFSTGPVRANGSFKVRDNEGNSFSGTVCAESLNQNAKTGVRAGNGQYYEGNPSPTSGDCADSLVSKVWGDLKVPEISGSHEYSGGIFIPSRDTGYIDVPAAGEGDPKIYDIYLDSLTFGEDYTTLIIRMPEKGRLTRIFVRKMSQTLHYVTIKVMHGDQIVENDDYAGDLLFYVPHDLKIKADQYEIQGSFISTGTITVENQIKFAGQLVANNIVIGDQVDGSGFKYKPFDPPTVDLATASDKSSHLQEGREHNYVNIVLDKKATLPIKFKYCFEAAGDSASHKGDGKKLASKFDFADNSMPWYNGSSCATYRTANFKASSDTLAEPIEVMVYDDPIYEDDEEFIMHIFDLEGAVLKNGLSHGTITLTIDDNDGLLKSASGTAVTAIEDTKYTFGLNDFPIFDNDGITLWSGKFRILIVTPPSYKDSLKIDNEVVEWVRPIPSDIILDRNTRWYAMDYNPPHDSFGVHFDSLEFKVAHVDGEFSDSTYKLYINITPVNDKPEVSSNGFKIYEHGKTSMDRIATGGFDIVDPDDSTFSYKFIVGANDSADLKKVDSLFVIDSVNGTISVKENIDLNYESDSLLYVYVVVKDSSKSTGDYEDALADTVKVRISILDTNEAPVIADQVFEVAENSKKDTEVLPKDWKEGNPKNVQAEDPDLPTAKNDWGKFKYSIQENPNFVIDSITGLITVKDKASLDFEDKTKNEFNLSVYVKDGGGLVDSAIVTIKVTNANEPPEFEDDGSDNFFAFEHSKSGTTVIKRWTVYDPDADDAFDELTVSLADSNGKASINATEIFAVRLVENNDSIFAELFVKDSAKLDFETIYKTLGDSVFTVIVSLTDDDSSTSSLTKHVVVRDINENPTIENKQELIDDGLNVDENSNAGDTVGTIVATDPDIWNEFSYRIADGDALNGKGDSAYFNIDKNGVITVAKSGTLDYETDSIYVIKVIVTDNGKSKGFENLSDSVVVTIKLNDKNEPPEIDPDPDPDPDCVGEKCNECDATIKDCGKPDIPPPDTCTENCGYKDDKGRIIVNVREHSPKNFVILEYVIKDSEKGDLERDTVFFENTNNSGADKIFGIKKETADNVNYKLVVFVKDSSKLDYETAKHSHDLTLVVADVDDLTLRDTVLRVINIIDINENPVIADTTLKIKENRPNGTVVGALKASDPDTSVRYSTLTYNILDKVPFKMDSNKVVVADASKLNFEKQKIFTFQVSVSDGELADTATVTVELEDDGDAPHIIPDLPDDPDCVGEKCKECDATFAKCDNPPDELDPDCVDGKCGFVKGDTIHVGIRENSPKGTKILEYYVEDEDAGDLATMKVYFKDKNKSGSDSLFVITDKLVKDSHGYKFELSVKTDSLDYETTKHEHFIVIYVVDKDSLRDSVFRVINIIDVNERPFIKNAEFDLDEHNKPNIAIDTIEWGDDRDLDGISNPEFQKNRVTLLGGDTAFFDVDSNGVIWAKKTLNYETDDTTYVLYVSAVDRNDSSLFMTDSVIILLKNIPETPYITTPEFDVDENPKNGYKIGQLESEDLDDLKNEQKRTYTVADNKYVEVTEDGKILVKDGTLFDYEKINEFVIDVTVTDPDTLSSTSKITIIIKDLNEAPEIKDTTINVPEDTKPGSIIDTVKATDPDTCAEYSKLTYTIVEGDTSTFKIDPEKGIVTLKKKLDYEDKNKYELKVRVDDGKLADTATVMVYVKDVEERSNVEITVVDDHDAPPYNKPDSVYTRQPVVELCWHTGRTEGKKTSWNDEKCESEKLEQGENVIIKDYYDPTTNFPALDTVVIFYSNTLPEVTISANGDGRSPHNIYTIVETTDAKDSNIYVNKKSNDIFVTVYDPALALKNDKDSLQIIKIPTDLDTVHVSSKYYDSMNYVVKEGVSLDPIADNAVRNLNKDSSVNVSYVTKVGGIEVTVSYTENKKGDVVKTPVTHSDGKVSMDEVMTVTYLTKDKDGKEISVSYKADAITGKPLKVDSEGNLMTDGAAKSEKGPSGLSTVGIFNVAYSQISKSGDSLKVSYAVDEKGKLIASSSGDIGYHVSYSYTDICGNSATKSVFIVLDKYEPKVEILSPTHGDIIYSNFVTVKWTVDGEVQDTLNTQGLEKGANIIVRFYRDKAGNEASDTVFVVMKDGKKVDLAVEQPVTEISKDKVDEYYSKNQPKEGQTYAVSVKNPTTGKEVVTEIGGSFGRNDVSEKKNEPYPGVENPSSHLGPTLVLDVKVPVISGTSGLATMDDIMSKDGMILVEGIDASGDIVGADSTGSDKNVAKISVEDYIFGKKNSKDTSSLYRAHCVDEVRERYKPGDDFSKINLYNSKLTAKIWIYSSLGNFVDYYSFEQPLNDPDLVDESGLLKMYFELKPDKDGIVRAEDGRAFATGAYVYKVEAKVRSEVLCDIPSLTKKSGKKMGDIVKNDDNLLKSFGYRRPVVK